MIKKALISVTVVIMAVMLLLPAGCSESPLDLIVGSWKTTATTDNGTTLTQIYRFTDDGKCSIHYTISNTDGSGDSKTTTIECSYTIYGNLLYLEKAGESQKLSYRFEVEKDSLTLETASEKIVMERID